MKSISIKGISVLLNFATSKYFIDKLGAASFGNYALAFGILAISSTFIGVGPGLQKLKDNKTQENKTGEGVYVLINLSIVLLIAFVVQLFYNINWIYFVIIAVMGFNYFLVELIRIDGSGNEYIFFKDIVRSIFVNITLFIGVNQTELILLSTSLGVLTFLLFRNLYTRNVVSNLFTLMQFSKEKYRDSSVNSVTNGITILKSRNEIFLAGIFLGPAAIGLYSVLQNLSKLINLPLVALNADIGKKIVKSIQNNALENGLDKQIKITKYLSLIISIVCALGLPLYLNFYSFKVTPTNYMVSLILNLAFLINPLFGPVGLIAQLSGLKKTYLKTTIITVVFSALMSVLFLEMFGIIALAVINLFSFLVWNYPIKLKIKKDLKLWE